jgi:hypothetical protein
VVVIQRRNLINLEKSHHYAIKSIYKFKSKLSTLKRKGGIMLARPLGRL